jgi:NADH-quinone oxidoreductase subunit D
MVCEQMMGLAVPERAIWLRTCWLSTPASSVIAGSSATYRTGPWAILTSALRRSLRTQTLRLTGNRIHPMATRVGGLAVDADDARLNAERQVTTQAARVSKRC